MEAEGVRIARVIRLEARDLWVRPPGPRQRHRFGSPDGYAVRGVDISIAAGEWIGVTGPNGGGKTSLLLALAGLWPPARGEVRIEGATGRRPRGSVAVVLQDPSAQLLQPTVLDEVAFAARNLDLPDALPRAGTWIGRLGLEADARADPRSLSAGRQQLVLLAGALAAGPRVLIADEPGAHLDANARTRVLEVVEAERRDGLAILWATQDECELGRATRVLDMGGAGRDTPEPADGRTQATGPTLVAIEVAAWNGGSGPRVATPEAFTIPIPERGVTALAGPNGSGKSVLLAAVAGIERSEQIRLSSVRALEPPPILVSQYPERMFFEEVVRDELCYAAVSRGLSRAAVLEAAERSLDRLGLDPSILDARMWELAGGLKRIVEVVAALIAPAELVLLDEPTAGLDPVRRRGLARLVATRAASSAILIASQDSPWLSDLGVASFRIDHPASTPNPSKKTD